ncbi:hypothetical protein HS041_36575 [Planomonospora sp. ID67723]|uniref:hypothetical protein n=1 Tax=Planomonospora sp. ID67723 TaxID=2738134 RepID=UPI0018C3E460|nr:hypothetical protein [Planomonospora sp. ID67723]MBG0833221.1 hypothetical protein [Planomonospora sp. ID67723]
MTPTLAGRIQSRIFLLCTVGLVWTLLITLVLPVGFAPLSRTYMATLTALALVGVLGTFLWEPLYHLLQQFRWEKDWPAVLILLQGLPEGWLVYVVLRNVVGIPVDVLPFVIHFATTWFVVFACLHGPLRVPFIRWRFRGGRLI